MASPLTVIPASTNAARAFGAPEGASAATEGFAALLGGAEPAIASAATVARSSDGAPPTDLAGLVKLVLGFVGGEADAGDGEKEAGDPVAAPVPAAVMAATAETEVPEEAVEMLAGLVQQLAGLRDRLAAGEPVTGQDLLDIEQGAEALASAFGIAPGTLPELDRLQAIVKTADELPLGRLTRGVGLMSEMLADGSGLPAELRDKAAALSQRLAAMVVALNEQHGLAAAAGLEADVAELDPALKAALARLAPPTTEAPLEPELALPALKLPDTVIAGKTAAAPAEAKPAAAEAAPEAAHKNEPAKPDVAAAGRNPEQRPEQPVERPQPQRDSATVAAAPAEQPAPANPAAAPAGADTSVRIDGAAAQPRVVQVGYQTSQQQLNLPQLAFELVRQINDGNTRFQIRLDPPELGKIDVRLDFDRSGQVTARLTVEKAETLDLMQRDQRGLEKALQQAGLDGQKTNLEFSLKQNPFAGQGQGDQQRTGSGVTFAATSEQADEPAPTVTLYRGSLSASGVNIIA